MNVFGSESCLRVVLIEERTLHGVRVCLCGCLDGMPGAHTGSSWT